MTNVDNSTPQLHRGVGGLVFAPALSLGGPADVALNVQAADFDADDRMDFAFASRGGTFAIWLNEVAGWRRVRPTQGAPNQDLFPAGRCAVGDLDGDEDVDVACANLAGVDLFLNRPDDCPLDPDSVSPGPCGCALPVLDADLDGVFDPCDNCVEVPNPDQSDVNGDDLGDVCEPLDPDAALPELDAELDATLDATLDAELDATLDAELVAELDATLDATLDAEAPRLDEGRMIQDARIVRRDAAPQDAQSVDALPVDAQPVDARLERPDQGRPDVRFIDAAPLDDAAPPLDDAARPEPDAVPPEPDAAPLSRTRVRRTLRGPTSPPSTSGRPASTRPAPSAWTSTATACRTRSTSAPTAPTQTRRTATGTASATCVTSTTATSRPTAKSAG